jgi:hypothetical protein
LTTGTSGAGAMIFYGLQAGGGEEEEESRDLRNERPPFERGGRRK